VGNDAALLQAQFAALAHRHITVSYTLVGVIVLVLALAGVGGWLGLRAFDAQLARMEAREAAYDAERKQFTDLLVADAAQRSQIEAKQTTIEHTVTTRDDQADQAIQAAVKPDASLESIASGLAASYSDVVGFGVVSVLPAYDDQHGAAIALEGHQAQQVTAYKIDRDRLSADLIDVRTSYTLEQTQNSSLTKDLAQCNDLNTKANGVIDGYKSLAKRSRKQKFLSGAAKVLLLAGGIVLGHKF
jgi:hypothetical protein